MTTATPSNTGQHGDGQALPASARLIDMAFDVMAAKTVYAAAELGLADLLVGGPLTSAELAERAGAHGPSLRRLLLALAALGVVAQTGADRFELADLGRPLRADAPDSVRGLVRMLCGPEDWRSWGELAPGVRTGETAWVRAHGMPWTEYYARNAGPAATFNLAMAEHTRDAAPGLVAAADLARFHTVVDVGGGDGTLMAEVLRSHPGVEGTVFDVPAGLAAATTTLDASGVGVGVRCRLVAGDFFVSVPAGADAYLLKQILHDWDDERAAAILGNIRTAMPPHGRVLVFERTLPERVTAGHDDAQSLLLDILMLVVTGGRERTEADFRRLFDATGFEAIRVGEPIPPFGYRVLEAAPA
jgi:hypothetical protein